MNKKIDYLRLSITDKCNLNCLYCTPLERSELLTHDEVLRYEEMTGIVEAFVASGIRKVRITGGEPLIKKNIADLVGMLKGINGLEEISMTTNGVYLSEMAYRLKDAGLDRINISIDTLKEDKYSVITGKDCFKDVWRGINSALESGLRPVKLNVVIMKGRNDEEIPDFVRLTMNYNINVRFIEFFQTNERSEGLVDYYMGTAEIMEKIEADFGEMEPICGVKGNGPAEYYKVRGSKGTIGFISSSSGYFCGQCNRVRLDCAGRVFPCLFSGCVCDLRHLLRRGRSKEEIIMRIKNIFTEKSKHNKKMINSCNVEMSSMGG